MIDTKTESIKLYQIDIPADAFRRLSDDFLYDLKDGKYISNSIYLFQVYKDGRYFNPSKMIGEHVDRITYITLIGVDAGYESRIRSTEGLTDGDALSTLPLEGIKLEGEEGVFKPGGVPAQKKTYLWQSNEYGLTRVSCKFPFYEDQSQAPVNGTCYSEFQIRPNLVLNFSFPWRDLDEWEYLQAETISLVEDWNLRKAE